MLAWGRGAWEFVVCRNINENNGHTTWEVSNYCEQKKNLDLENNFTEREREYWNCDVEGYNFLLHPRSLSDNHSSKLEPRDVLIAGVVKRRQTGCFPLMTRYVQLFSYTGDRFGHWGSVV